MQLRAGSILIAHPVHADREHTGHVVYITESTQRSTMGITLNYISDYDLIDLMHNRGIEWHGDRELYYGGEYNPQAMIMLHTDEWYSSNTMQVNDGFSISSDVVMLEKMSMGNTPDWYKLFVGCKGWEPQMLNHELKDSKPKWLLLNRPSRNIIESDSKRMWDLAVEECSQKTIDNYF